MSKIQNPLNARHIEHNQHQDGSIARRGSVAKRSNDGVAVHPAFASSAAAPDLAFSGAPDPKTGKAVPVHPSHSRGAKSDDLLHELGRAMMAEATFSGSTVLPSKVNSK